MLPASLGLLARPNQLAGKLARLLLLPPVRALAISGIAWLLVFSLCRATLWRNPHSAYFQSETVYDLQYSRVRTAEALRLVDSANKTLLPASGRLNAGSNPIICAALVTVKREPVQYLAETVGSLLDALHPDERAAIHVLTIFANADPAIHPDWNSTWLHNLVDAAEGYKISKNELAKLAQSEKDRDFQWKGIVDYTYALDRCMQTGAPYLVVIEDDLMFADGWMTRTLNGLLHLALKKDSLPNPWLYLRLFYTETHLMWENTDFWYANMWLAFALATLSGLSVMLLVRRRWASSRPHLDNLTLAVLCLITIPGFVALLYMAGKYTLSPLRGVVLMNQRGCCSQALLFPRAQVPGVVKWLRDKDRGQTDLLIEEYADVNGLDRYALAPQAAQHIGLYSSRSSALGVTQSTWGFYFETNDARKLKKEHIAGMAGGIQQWDMLRTSPGS